MFCNLAILIFASSIQCNPMSALVIILCVYLAINLAMLAFKSVREAWPSILTVYEDLSSLWKGFFSKDLKWWEWPLSCLFFLVMEPILILLMVLFTLIPIPVYIRALFSATHKKGSIREIPPPEEWGANTAQKHVVFDVDLPFAPSYEDVLYVENEYNQAVNEYILEHYDELCQKFTNKHLIFNYYPRVCNKAVPIDVLRYMFPFLKTDFSFVNESIAIETLQKHLIFGTIEGPALIHSVKSKDDGTPTHCFSYCPLVPDSEIPLGDQFEWYTRYIQLFDDNGPHYMVALPYGDDVADWCFNDGDADSFNECALHLKAQDLELVNEIRERIYELRKRGYQLGLLQDLIEEQPTLSRLVIDKDFRIFLPDYNNVEITMSPLPKAVYLLFLKHPEGILFKHLHDYYSELLEIYKQISNRVVEKNILRSIQDITDPSKNSINEKCTRIREAFLKQFDYVYAQHYFITGKRGEPKKITLPRELVDLQAL